MDGHLFPADSELAARGRFINNIAALASALSKHCPSVSVFHGQQQLLVNRFTFLFAVRVEVGSGSRRIRKETSFVLKLEQVVV
jgi:hypothetical protein